MKPNILFIMTDDQGPWALGCAGNDEIRTPNIDALAEEGMMFDNFFCASPVCSPARASLITGMIPSQHGVHDWISRGNMPIRWERGDMEEEEKGEYKTIEYLSGIKGYTDYLAENGYNCLLSGKWHMGDSMKPQMSFTHWYSHQGGGGPYYDAPMIRDGVPYDEPEYLTYAITNEAVSLIDDYSQREEPFYLSVHYTAPHTPWIDSHPKELVDSYDNCAFDSCPDVKPHPWIRGEWGERKENLKGYFAAITAVDLSVGRMVDKLKEKGVYNDTLIIYTSDNGFNCGHHGIWGKGNGTWPLNMYDTSVKVPFIACQPGIIPSGIKSDAMVSAYDFMPTLLDYTGINYVNENNLPGVSFASVLKGEDKGFRDSVVVYDEYGPVRMIRTREWKYIHRYPYGPHELYNLIKDPNEDNNLYKDIKYMSVINDMRGQLKEWFLKYVNPDRDGVHEGVTGNGQINLSGTGSNGRQSFTMHDSAKAEIETKEI